ncbi:hypothetical protein DPMN_005011 [Dreissena polymorpha]|uniref:Uncharacterized protein n=1 Tax=Dreissena polymorpha TaxID=45954 RepID=A0A9D4RWE9_DREPO|nr:hypothetical protein DPMN_005011 [Dreissena polymorpha]
MSVFVPYIRAQLPLSDVWLRVATTSSSRLYEEVIARPETPDEWKNIANQFEL